MDRVTIKTKLGQTALTAKNDASAAMVRLVRELAARLEEAGLTGKDDPVMCDNVVYGFLSHQPKLVTDEVAQG